MNPTENEIDTDTEVETDDIDEEGEAEEASAEDVAEGLKLLREKRAAAAVPMFSLWLERSERGGLKKLGEFPDASSGRKALVRADDGAGTYILAHGTKPPENKSRWVARKQRMGSV